MSGTSSTRTPEAGVSIARTRALTIWQRYQAEPARSVARRGEEAEKTVHREQQIGPPMARSQHVRGAENGRGDAAVPHELLARSARLDVRAHHGRRLSDADVYEMADGGAGGGGHRRTDGRQVH
jgi:hypothetical protein